MSLLLKHVRLQSLVQSCLILTMQMLYIFGLPLCEINKLQRVQNIAAKLVPNASDNSWSCLKQLHWLPIHLRIKHKVLTLLYKSIHGEPPTYLADLIQKEIRNQAGLRSENVTQRLSVPFTRRKTFASRSYSVVAPMWWNDIPNFIKSADSTDIFKAQLKTFLYDKF